MAFVDHSSTGPLQTKTDDSLKAERIDHYFRRSIGEQLLFWMRPQATVPSRITGIHHREPTTSGEAISTGKQTSSVANRWPRRQKARVRALGIAVPQSIKSLKLQTRTHRHLVVIFLDNTNIDLTYLEGWMMTSNSHVPEGNHPLPVNLPPIYLARPKGNQHVLISGTTGPTKEGRDLFGR